MSIALRVAGSWVELRADGNVVIPGSPQAGDRMFLFVAWKTYTITLTTPNGWTAIGTAFADGTTAAGNGTGSVKVMAFYRDWQSGDTGAFLDFSSSPAEAAAVISVWSKAATEVWSAPLTATAGLSWGTGSTTTSASSTVAVPSGGVVLAMIAFRDDSATMTRPTTAIDDASSAITWNGDHVESPATHGNFTAGSDGSYDLGYRLVTTGATATLRVTGTLSASETGSAKWVAQGVATATNVYAPTVGASVAIPPRPVGIESLVGRLGYARLSYLVLGTEVAKSHFEDSAWVQVATYPERITSASATLAPSVTRTSAPAIPAPHVTAAVAIPEETGLAGLTGRLGAGRLGYMILGDEQRSRVSAVADVGGAPATLGMTASVADGTATASNSSTSVDAPIATAAAASYTGVGDVGGTPAVVAATGSALASVADLGPSPAAVGATADALLLTAHSAPAPAVATMAAAVQDGSVATSAETTVNAPVTAATGSTTTSTPAVAYPAELVTSTASTADGSANPGVIGPLVTVAASALAAVGDLGGVPVDVLAASASVAAGSVLGNPNVTASAPLVGVTADTAAATAALGSLPGLATATVALGTGAAGVGFVPDTVTMAASVTSAGTSTWMWTAPVTATAVGSVTDGTTSTLGVGTVDAPLVTAAAYPRAAEVQGRLVGKGPDGDASAIVPRAVAEHAAPSGSAMNVRTP